MVWLVLEAPTGRLRCFMAEDQLQDFDNYEIQVEIRNLWRGGKTGVLNCDIDGYSKSLYFRDGVVLFANSEDPADKLPQVLIRQGRFTEEQYESVAPNFNEEVSVGRNLVDMGLITQQELVGGAKEQVYVVFSVCMQARSGMYAFEEGDLPDGVVDLPLDFPRHFFRALLAMEDKSWISEQFGPSLEFVCEKNDQQRIDFAQIEVADFAEQIYDLIDGERDFNHMAFEVDIDDFMLLKFLYSLKFLDLIKIHEPPPQSDDDDFEEDFEEDLPDTDGVRDELGEAIRESEELDKLGNPGMDETVSIPAMEDLEQPVGSLETTMEISKDALDNAIPALKEQDEDDPWKEEDDPFMAELEKGEEPEEEPPEEETQGLDDLDDMSSQLLEEELDKMTPDSDLEDDDDDGGIDALDEDFADEELVDDDDEFDESEDDEGRGLFSLEGRKRPLIMAAIVLLASAAVLAIRFQLWPSLETFYASVLPAERFLVEDPEPVEEVAEQQQDEAEQATDTPTPDGEQQIADNERKTGEQPAADGEQKTGEPGATAANETQDSKQPTVADKTTTEPPPKDMPRMRAPETVSAGVNRGFHSPVADNWDSNKGKPKNYDQSLVREAKDLTSRLESRGKEQPQAANTTKQPQADPSTTPPKDPTPADPQPPRNTTNTAENAAPPAVTATQPDPTPVKRPPVVAGTGQANDLMASGRFQDAARLWRDERAASRDKYTLAVFMACQDKSVGDAYAALSGDQHFYILPQTYRGRSCYWVCWGEFDTYPQGTEQMDSLVELLKLEERPYVKQLKELIP